MAIGVITVVIAVMVTVIGMKVTDLIIVDIGLLAVLVVSQQIGANVVVKQGVVAQDTTNR